MAEFKERRGYPDELDYLWDYVVAFEGYRFVSDGEPFKYTVNENGILIQNEKIGRDKIEDSYIAALNGKSVCCKIGCILKRFMK